MVLRYFLFLVLSISSFNVLTQEKREQEFRINKGELPENIIPLLSDYLDDVKRLRFYKESDGEKHSYEVKFKKAKLFYSIEFDGKGQLEDVEFIIKENDIPNDALNSIKNYLSKAHGKFRIKKIQQQYPTGNYDVNTVLGKAFQNLISPEINYEIVIAAKDTKGYSEYEITFNAAGKHLLTRKLIAPKYDHVLFQ